MNTQQIARSIRIKALKMVHRASASHIGACLSIADMLAVLYGEMLDVDPQHPDDPNRDRLILSKGHAAAALYAALAECGFIPEEWLESYGQDECPLAGHVTQHGIPGVELSTGSLGHGLSFAAGQALAAKRSNATYRNFVILGDGECQEGSVWEAALFAAQHQLENLIVLVDRNSWQGLGRDADVMGLGDLAAKWFEFGWHAVDVDGHDHEALIENLESVPARVGKPTAIVCYTRKGKGVSFMEDQLEWHYKSPDDKQLQAAILEVKSS